MQEIVVVGAGGHGKVVVATARAAGFVVTKVVDSDAKKWGARLLGAEIVGPERAGLTPETLAVLAIGNNGARRDVAGRFTCRWATVVHPHASVHPTVRLGEGTVVFAGAVIQPDTTLGAHCIVNTGASLDHDNALGDFVHVAPGVHTAGNVVLESGVFLGVGVSVIPGRRVGEWATVGAGACVIRDVPARATVMGVPAQAR